MVVIKQSERDQSHRGRAAGQRRERDVRADEGSRATQGPRQPRQRWRRLLAARPRGLTLVRDLFDSEVVDPLARFELRDQPAGLFAAAGPGL